MMKEKENKEYVIKKLEKLKDREIWMIELLELRDKYKEFRQTRDNIQKGIIENIKDGKKKLLKVKK